MRAFILCRFRSPKSSSGCAAISNPLRSMRGHTCLQTGAIVLAACLVLGTARAHFAALSRRLHNDLRPFLIDTKPNVHICSRHYFNQTLDHFTFKQGSAKWLQRYFIYDGYRNGASKAPKPIFFYGGITCHTLAKSKWQWHLDLRGSSWPLLSL